MTIYKVYRDVPFNVKIMKDRYWDHSINKSISADMTETVTLEPYDGLECQVNNDADAPLLHINEGMMSDHTSVAAAQGCLLPEGNEYLISYRGYYGASCNKGLKVNYETGVVEGFSSMNKLSTGRSIDAVDCRVIQKVYFDGDMRAQIIWLVATNNYIGVNEGKLGLYVSGWTLGANVLESGIYWVQVTYSNRTFKIYRLADNDETYTAETLPELASWVEELSVEDCDSPLASTSYLTLSNDSEAYWGGKMYLSTSRIYYGDGFSVILFYTQNLENLSGMLATGVSCDGQAHSYNVFYKEGKFVADTAEAKSGYRWCGTVSAKPFDTTAILKKCYTEVGTPTLLYPEVFNFSSLNYLVSDSALPFRQYFAVDLKFISKVTIANSNYTQDIFWDDSENNHGFGVASNKWRIWNGAATTGGSAVNNTTYWTQLVEQIGQGTKLYVLEDDGTYTLDTLPDIAQWTLAVSVSTGLFDTTGMKVRIGNGYTTLAEPWRGKIDLSNTCIYTGSQVGDSTSWTVYWKPFRSVSF